MIKVLKTTGIYDMIVLWDGKLKNKDRITIVNTILGIEKRFWHYLNRNINGQKNLVLCVINSFLRNLLNVFLALCLKETKPKDKDWQQVKRTKEYLGGNGAQSNEKECQKKERAFLNPRSPKRNNPSLIGGKRIIGLGNEEKKPQIGEVGKHQGFYYYVVLGDIKNGVEKFLKGITILVNIVEIIVVEILKPTTLRVSHFTRNIDFGLVME